MMPRKVFVFITFISLAKGYLYQLSYPQHNTEIETGTVPLQTSKAFSVVHCNLICINTNRCISTMYKDDYCTLLKKNHYGKQQTRQLKTRGAIISQIEVCREFSDIFSPSRHLHFQKRSNRVTELQARFKIDHLKLRQLHYLDKIWSDIPTAFFTLSKAWNGFTWASASR